MDFTQLTIDILTQLKNLVGNYGWAIILITIAVRLALWGVNAQQQKSMRTMQLLQPKMKAIQDRYKSNPQMMQQKMMEFYKENKFNPFGGCLPLLVQLPIFILLYSALMSPQFIQAAGDSSFFFIDRLDNTMKSHTGKPDDGTFSVGAHDTFSIPKKIEVVMNDGSKVEVKVSNPQKALQIQGELEPSKPVDFKISLDNIDLKFEQLNKIASTKVPVINNMTKEVETVDFKRQDSILAATVPTDKTQTTFHFDVLFLVLFFGVTMWFATKLTTSMNSSVKPDPTQQAMQQTMGTVMPFMITAMFFFFPIPAGVLLYLVVSNLIQILQTYIINKQLDAQDAKKTEKIDEYDLKNAKKIEAKNIKDENDNK